MLQTQLQDSLLDGGGAGTGAADIGGGGGEAMDAGTDCITTVEAIAVISTVEAPEPLPMARFLKFW